MSLTLELERLDAYKSSDALGRSGHVEDARILWEALGRQPGPRISITFPDPARAEEALRGSVRDDLRTASGRSPHLIRVGEAIRADFIDTLDI